MSTEAKAPPELGAASPPAQPFGAAATAGVQPGNNPSSGFATSNGVTSSAIAKPKNGKPNPAHDKRWLENFNSLRPCIKEDGSMDYSSLDEELQKRMLNFVREQRKSNRKRVTDEPSPMTDERFRLLSEAGFDFTPNETNKAKREQEKAKKVKKAAATGEGAPAPSFKFIERADPAKNPTLGKAKKSTPMKSQEPTSDDELAVRNTPNTSQNAEDSKSKMPMSTGPKSASKSSSPTGARKKTGKPTYLEMAHDAIFALKDRTGSSIPAISKWVVANYVQVTSVTPNTFKNRLNAAIKQGVKDGRFMKVKNSFKINSEWTKKQKAAAKAKDAAKKKAEKQRQKDLEKAKQQKQKEKADMEKKAAEEKAAEAKKVAEAKKAAEAKMIKEKEPSAEEKAEAERRKKRKEEKEARRKLEEAHRKFIEQQLRKRRYPIEDTRLHRENKKWGVKPPEGVIKRPALPHTLACLIPPHLRANSPPKSTGSVASASASGTGKLLGGDNDRGLITDAVHVFHFFCGDVGLADSDHPVPKFSLKTLLYALDEVLNGNAKVAKSLPPLLTHLFVTALRMVTAPRQVDGDGSVDPKVADLGPVELRLQEDISELRKGLNPVSWSQVCFFYMDLMGRYYASDDSLEKGVLPGEGKLDMSYFWSEDQADDDEIEAEMPARPNPYLGDPQGVVAKGYTKLLNQEEPWTLKADELIALLRIITDDILAKRPDLAEDIAGRGTKLNELFKAKRAAVVKYNKVRLAYEGPKKPSRPKKPESSENHAADDKKDEKVAVESKEENEKPFEPTATKQQFVAAEKAYHKAVDAYDNGLNKLISRTEPICFDRKFNAIYFFRHDPTMLHVEAIKKSLLPTEIKTLGPELTPFSSWHSIDTKPLFGQFLASLDERGEREDEALRVCSGLTILKRRLLDEKKEDTRAAAREREKEDLERRRENAQSACDAEDGRRSGRLAGMAQDELKKLDEESKHMIKAHKEEERQEEMGREKASDFSLLTGLQLVTDLFVGQRGTRSNKKSASDIQSEASLLANVPSNKLWMEKSTGGNGTIHVLVEALFALEDVCNDLSPWARQDLTREAWRKQLTEASCAWAIDCVMQLGPSNDSMQEVDSNDDTYLTNPTKKQKVDPASGTSLASIITTLKLCLKDLELRVFEMSGKKKAIEEADQAAVNEDASSDDGDDGELNKRQNCWKVKINALRRVPTSRYGLIRDIIVAAITVARKSHLNQVAVELKAALHLHRPSAAGEAKSAAIQVLENHGGYDGSDDDDDDVNFDELIAADSGNVKTDNDEDSAIASMLCDEVKMISGSVGGDDFADTSDWSDAIRDCKSVSRLALMIQSFLSRAEHVLSQLKSERNNLDSILGLNARRTSRNKMSIKKHDSSTLIWCNAKLTDKLVKARVQGYPWWPAHVCVPLDTVVAEALKGSGYTLISSVGNSSMFMVAERDVVEFAEEADKEDLSQYDKSTLKELHESMAIAKKLWRLRNRGVASSWSKKSKPQHIEEKKTAH